MNARALRWQSAALRVQLSFLILAHLCRKAGFDPDQPRDEQGRWMDTGGSTPPALSYVMPDNGWQPGVQYAQNDRQTGYPVDLRNVSSADMR